MASPAGSSLGLWAGGDHLSEYAEKVPHNVITGGPLTDSVTWAMRDFTPGELEAKGYPDGVVARQEYWRRQHEWNRSGIEMQNTMSRLWGTGEELELPPVDLPTPPLVTPRG